MLSQGRPLAGRENSKLERPPVPSYVRYSARPSVRRCRRLRKCAQRAHEPPRRDWDRRSREAHDHRAATVQAAMLATRQITPDRVFPVDVEVGAVGEGTIVPTELLFKAN